MRKIILLITLLTVLVTLGNDWVKDYGLVESSNPKVEAGLRARRSRVNIVVTDSIPQIRKIPNIVTGESSIDTIGYFERPLVRLTYFRVRTRGGVVDTVTLIDSLHYDAKGKVIGKTTWINPEIAKWILNEVSTAENIEIDSELIKTK